jgi:pilus assembly protein Flp/PilA
MRKFIQSLARDERGVSALEYAILAGLIVGVLVTAVGVFSGDLSTAFTNLGNAVTTATAPK